jgi:hypothetical protein
MSQAGGGDRKIEYTMPIVLDADKVLDADIRNMLKYHPLFNGGVTAGNAGVEKHAESIKIFEERIEAPPNVAHKIGGRRRTRKKRNVKSVE